MPGDAVAGFRFGNAAHQPLKTFIQRQALQSSQCNITKTYVFAEQRTRTVRAFLTLLCSQIALDPDDRPAEHEGLDRYDYYPAVKIARLGVDRRLQGKGIGSSLIGYAFKVAIEQIMPIVGCRFVIVDSKEGSINFYRQHGFTLIEPAAQEDANGVHYPMYLDLQELIAAQQDIDGTADPQDLVGAPPKTA